MTEAVEPQLCRATDAVMRVIGGEHILVPVRGDLADLQSIFVTGEVGHFIWDQLKDPCDRPTIVSAVMAAFDVEADRARTDCDRFLGELAQEGLVEEVA